MRIALLGTKVSPPLHPTPALPDAKKGTVAAVAITGDLRHTASQPYNVGTGANASGVSHPSRPPSLSSPDVALIYPFYQIWPRSEGELAGLAAWEGKIQSWCTAEDPVCAGGFDVEAHGAYMEQKEEIASWVKVSLGV